MQLLKNKRRYEYVPKLVKGVINDKILMITKHALQYIIPKGVK